MENLLNNMNWIYFVTIFFDNVNREALSCTHKKRKRFLYYKDPLYVTGIDRVYTESAKIVSWDRKLSCKYGF